MIVPEHCSNINLSKIIKKTRNKIRFFQEIVLEKNHFCSRLNLNISITLFNFVPKQIYFVLEHCSLFSEPCLRTNLFYFRTFIFIFQNKSNNVWNKIKKIQIIINIILVLEQKLNVQEKIQ